MAYREGRPLKAGQKLNDLITDLRGGEGGGGTKSLIAVIKKKQEVNPRKEITFMGSRKKESKNKTTL